MAKHDDPVDGKLPKGVRKSSRRLFKALRLGSGYYDRNEIKSAHDGSAWTVGAWRRAPESIYNSGIIRCCGRGLHASPNFEYACGYVRPGVLAIVEVAGDSASTSDKSAHEYMRIVEARVPTRAVLQRVFLRHWGPMRRRLVALCETEAARFAGARAVSAANAALLRKVDAAVAKLVAGKRLTRRQCETLTRWRARVARFTRPPPRTTGT